MYFQATLFSSFNSRSTALRISPTFNPYIICMVFLPGRTIAEHSVDFNNASLALAPSSSSTRSLDIQESKSMTFSFPPSPSIIANAFDCSDFSGASSLTPPPFEQEITDKAFYGSYNQNPPPLGPRAHGTIEDKTNDTGCNASHFTPKRI